MTQNIKTVFYPGIGVEIIFNIDSNSPEIASSIIFDCDYQNNLVTISQTTPPILPNKKYKTMNITTLCKNEKFNLLRIGIDCRIESINSHYELSGGKTTGALVLKYKNKSFDANIRSAYRLQPGKNFSVSGRLSVKGSTLLSESLFKIHNISLSGIGLIVPLKVKNSPNPLLKLKPGFDIEFDLILKNIQEKRVYMPIKTHLKIRRVNSDYNEVSGFIGLAFTDINKEDEETLGKFIHEAQLDSIRKRTGY